MLLQIARRAIWLSRMSAPTAFVMACVTLVARALDEGLWFEVAGITTAACVVVGAVCVAFVDQVKSRGRQRARRQK